MVCHLDSRETYTKTDWIIWTATMAKDKTTFESFVDPVYSFMNETVDRIPMSDLVFTDSPNNEASKLVRWQAGISLRCLKRNCILNSMQFYQKFRYIENIYYNLVEKYLQGRILVL